jgi:hypothetical protein
MSEVYSHSSLNLVAADSPDGDIECFFHDRSEFPMAWKANFPRGRRVPQNRICSESAQEPPIYTWNCINPTTRAMIDESCVATRAWTLQERLLSRRALYLGRDQVAWECRQGNAYEDLSDMFNEGVMKLSPGNFSSLVNTREPFTSAANVQQWDYLVKAYSKRKLTFRKDKLVAIAGLARPWLGHYCGRFIADAAYPGDR